MTFELSANTKAILLLTAPLIAGRGKDVPSVKPLGVGEYRRLARRLREMQRQPADLLDSGVGGVVSECRGELDSERLERLLGRGFLLAQAVERWRTRAIWVLSRADADYPRRLKQRLGEDAPPVLYGCGDAAILGVGGLAVVGSRNVDEALIEYTGKVGRLAASAGRGLVSGGARGIDRAAMRGALDAGGRVAGVLADSLERAAMLREHREALMNKRLVLVSPYDPAARFQVGHAMQRNKLIYALSDAALVVSSDYGKGGTWTGAVEQLDRLKLVPVHVRANGETGRGLEALRERGATPWPEPKTPEALEKVLDAAAGEGYGAPGQQTLLANVRDGSEAFDKAPDTSSSVECGAPAQRTPPTDVREESALSEGDRQAATPARTPEPCTAADSTPADELFAKVRELIERMDGSRTEDNVAEALQVSKKQAGVWLERFTERKIRERFNDSGLCETETKIADSLGVSGKLIRVCLKRLVEEKVLEKVSRPVRYRSNGSVGPLFDQ